MDHSSTRVANEKCRMVQDELGRLGLLCRVFGRAKERHSASHKKECKSYGAGRKLQDAIGIRVALYFSDDLDIAITAIKRLFEGKYVDATRDAPSPESFCPQRINLIFRLDPSEIAQVDLIRSNPSWVDGTFELQIRTVLSEGWHEVDHDLRYKCLDDWNGQEDLARSLNGLMATLETCDWAMLQLFDELALRHYRQRNWDGMLRCKLRLRIAPGRVGNEISSILTADQDLAKKIFRGDRGKILREVARSSIQIPSCFDNWVFVMNHLVIHDERIAALAPTPIQEQLTRYLEPDGNGNLSHE